jgi:hypothetical protein
MSGQLDTNAQKQHLFDEIATLSAEDIQTRIKDIDGYLSYGKYIKWGIRKHENVVVDMFLITDYTEDTFYINYRTHLNQALFDKCKSANFVPKLAFTF